MGRLIDTMGRMTDALGRLTDALDRLTKTLEWMTDTLDRLHIACYLLCVHRGLLYIAKRLLCIDWHMSTGKRLLCTNCWSLLCCSSLLHHQLVLYSKLLVLYSKRLVLYIKLQVSYNKLQVQNSQRS